MNLDRVLLLYQRLWLRESAQLAAIVKSRRIGISYTEACDAVLHAGGDVGPVMYQSYNIKMVEEFITDCEHWARRLDKAIAEIGESLIDLDDAASVRATRMRFRSGQEIQALVSSARAWRSRGRPGTLGIIDEACHMDNLKENLTAALGIRVWGGRLRIISTHRGAGSAFASLIRDIEDGTQPGVVHRVTFRDAIDQGLYRKVCQVTGQDWTAAGEAEWEAAIRAEFGWRAGEELDCVPAAGTGAWLDWDLIRACEDAAAGDPDRAGDGPTFIGIDQAIRQHLWVAWVLEMVGDVAWTREVRVLRGGTFGDRDAAVADLVRRYKPVRIAADETGLGLKPVEDWRRAHGAARVEGVSFSPARKLDLATALRERVEDRRIRIPPSADIRSDLHAVRAEAGLTGAPRLVADDGPGGHADRFWAAALACGAAHRSGGPVEGRVGAPSANAALWGAEGRARRGRPQQGIGAALARLYA